MTKKEMADYLVANQKPLWQSAFYLTKNEDDASDLTQSVFLKALCNFEKFTDSTNLGGWLYTIMRNLFINQCRSADQVRISRSDKEYETAPNDLMYGNLRVGRLPLHHAGHRTCHRHIKQRIQYSFSHVCIGI